MGREKKKDLKARESDKCGRCKTRRRDYLEYWCRAENAVATWLLFNFNPYGPQRYTPASLSFKETLDDRIHQGQNRVLHVYTPYHTEYL